MAAEDFQFFDQDFSKNLKFSANFCLVDEKWLEDFEKTVVFRRSHVLNDPINHVDPSGKICAVVQSISQVLQLGALGLERNNLLNELDRLDNATQCERTSARKQQIFDRISQIDSTIGTINTPTKFLGNALQSCDQLDNFSPKNNFGI